VAYGFQTVSQLGIGYRGSPVVQEGHPALRRGPRAGDRLPDARVIPDGQPCWLEQALAEPRFHLLACGPVGRWDADRLAALDRLHPDLLAVHHLTGQAGTGVLHDPGGRALALLGVGEVAHYLVRPDGHVGYRAAGPDLDGFERYLARWLRVPPAEGVTGSRPSSRLGDTAPWRRCDPAP
jgi:hypothetical protein